jgi:alpha-beta hydrolase superfamily lysophospholipase
MDDSDFVARGSRDLLRALPSRRIGIAAALLVAAGGLSAGWVSLGTQQRKWIFQATPASSANADELAAVARSEGMDSVWIDHVSPSTGRAIRLHALYAAHADPKAPLMLFLHGARQYLGRSVFRIEQMRELGFSVLAIDYRGFGASTDELPSETGVVEDAAAAWHWLGERHPESARYIFGHSLGGAIAVQLVAEVPDAQGLIVEGTFTSIPAVFETMKWGWLPLTPLITQRFDALERIGAVRVPVLVVHGEQDTLIRPELGRALYERARGPKRFVLVEGGTHYSTNRLAREQYRGALRELFGLGA